MVMRRLAVWVVAGVMGVGLGGTAFGQAEVVRDNQGPLVAAPKSGRNGAGFMRKHEEFLKRTKEGPIGVLFIGDSITAGWAGQGKEVWAKNYEKWQAANFGIGGDRVEHVQWRVENGELEGIKPKVVVLMLGTNNTGGKDSAADIAAGDVKLVKTIREKLPESKVLVLGVFPRGPRPLSATQKSGPDAEKLKEQAEKQSAMQMEKIKAINAELAKLDDGKMVRYLDISEKFLVDGKIPMDVMPDQLHPNAKGYEIWAEAMGPTLEEMMK